MAGAGQNLRCKSGNFISVAISPSKLLKFESHLGNGGTRSAEVEDVGQYGIKEPIHEIWKGSASRRLFSWDLPLKKDATEHGIFTR